MSSNHWKPERDEFGKILLIAPAAPEIPAEVTEDQPPATDHQSPTISHRPSFDQLFPGKPKTKAAPPPEWAIWLAVVLVAVLGGTLLSRLLQAPASSRELPREAVSTPASVLSATQTPQATLDRAVVAYAAPDGQVLGALEAGRTYTPIARYGVTWAQLDIGEAAPIWVRLGDLPALTVAGLPDLAPKPTAIPPPVVVEQVAPAVVPAEACTEYAASFRASKRVERDGVPIGEVVAWSCVSQADADSQVAAQEAAMLAGP